MAGIKEFDADEVLDDDSAEGSDPDAMPDDEVDGSSLILSNAAGVGKEAKVAQIIRDLVRKEVAELLRQKTIDLEYLGGETWATATGDNGISALRGSVDAATINAISDWAASYDIPSGTETDGALIVRLAKDENPNDYRLFNGIALLNIGDFFKPSFITSPTYDYYVTTLRYSGRYAVGETIVLQHHGDDGHSLFYGGVPELEAAIQNLNSAFGEKADSADLQGLAEQLDGKEDARPFDASFDRNYYVKSNRDAHKYYLQLHNIVPALLPDVDTLFVQIKGQPVHTVAFNPSADTDQIIPIELSAAEASNLVNNLRDDTTLRFDLNFRNGSTLVVHERIEIPVLAAPPKREEREILAFNLSRSKNLDSPALPTDYTEWEACYILVGDGTREDTQILRTKDLAKGNLTNIGRGDPSFDWDSTTRIITVDNDALLIAIYLL